MSAAAVKIKLNPDEYSVFRRYKVNAVVVYQGNTFQNTTGFNSTPTATSSNWLLISQANTAPTIITINGNPFTLIKNPANALETIELNDMAVNGFRDSATFWPMAYYTGGGASADDPASWLVLNPIEELPQN